jgi:hypothetical protein
VKLALGPGTYPVVLVDYGLADRAANDHDERYDHNDPADTMGPGRVRDAIDTELFAFDYDRGDDDGLKRAKQVTTRPRVTSV